MRQIQPDRCVCDLQPRVDNWDDIRVGDTENRAHGRPLVGGLLANPVPRLFPSSFQLFVRYPYLLPAMVVSVITGMAAVSATVFLTETLTRHPTSKGSKSGIMQLLRHKPFQKVVTLYSINNGVMFSWEALYPLFAYTSVPLGGLGLDVRAMTSRSSLQVRTIGIILALSALLSIAMTAFVFPVLHRRIPEKHYLAVCKCRQFGGPRPDLRSCGISSGCSLLSFDMDTLT